jgi:SagB-type dehydrogenase family enzyme
MRASPHLVAFWQSGRLVLRNYATGATAGAHPLTIAVLDFFGEWRSPSELHRRAGPAARAKLERLLQSLVERTFLLVEGDVPPAEGAMARWQAWNPAAGFFHQATRDTPFDPIEVTRRHFASRPHAPPCAVKRYPGLPSVVLPGARLDGELSETLLARRTWRAFSRRPVRLGDLASMLFLAAGVVRWVPTVEGVLAPLKTSPSGGAVHPTEVYVLSLRVDGLARGLYYYDPARHRLRRLRDGASSRDVDRFLPRQPWFRTAAALVFFSCVFGRSQWRYQYPRAYRAALIEVGHVCQTFCLAATRLKLAPFCTMALADSTVDANLGLDGVSESVLYAAGVGRRPRGLDWAPAPPGEC